MGSYGKSDYKVIRVTPTLDTNAYAELDVLFNSVAIPNAVLGNGGCSKLVGMYLLNQNTDIIDIEFIFSENSLTLGTINATANISDADLEAGNITGAMKLDGSESKVSGIDNAYVYNVINNSSTEGSATPMLLQAADDSTSVYVAGIIGAGTPTLAADDIDLIFHIEYR